MIYRPYSYLKKMSLDLTFTFREIFNNSRITRQRIKGTRSIYAETTLVFSRSCKRKTQQITISGVKAVKFISMFKF